MWTCRCGARNGRQDVQCEACGALRDHTSEAIQESGRPKKQCAICGAEFQFWTPLHNGEDGKRRCAGCHMRFLESRASQGSDRCAEAGCTKTVAEHVAEFRRVVAFIGTPFTPRGVGPTEAEKRAALDALSERKRGDR